MTGCYVKKKKKKRVESVYETRTAEVHEDFLLLWITRAIPTELYLSVDISASMVVLLFVQDTQPAGLSVSGHRQLLELKQWLWFQGSTKGWTKVNTAVCKI